LRILDDGKILRIPDSCVMAFEKFLGCHVMWKSRLQGFRVKKGSFLLRQVMSWWWPGHEASGDDDEFTAMEDEEKITEAESQARNRRDRFTTIALTIVIAIVVLIQGFTTDTYIPERPDLTQWSDQRMDQHFRFTYEEMDQITGPHGLNWPDEIKTERKRYKTTRIEAFAIMCLRLAYPLKYNFMVEMMGCSKDRLCAIWHHSADLLVTGHGHLLDFNTQPFRARLPLYAQVIGDRSPLADCFGFVNGTLRFTCNSLVPAVLVFGGKHPHSHIHPRSCSQVAHIRMPASYHRV
jgi:hypothetical protein